MANKLLRKLGMGMSVMMMATQISGTMVFAAPEEDGNGEFVIAVEDISEDDMETEESERYQQAEETTWQRNYEYELSGSDIIVTKYVGEETVITLPARAVIDGVTYQTVIKSSNTFVPVTTTAFSVEEGVKASDLSYMFKECTALETLDLTGLDTSAVEKYVFTFYKCTSLTSVDLSGFDGTAAKNLSGMFAACENLQKVDLSSFATANVNNLTNMFDGCEKLTSVNLSGIDTSNVKGASMMFKNCKALESIDLSHFDMTNVEFINDMLLGCDALKELKTPKNLPDARTVALPKNLTDKSTGTEYSTLPHSADTLTLVYDDGSNTGEASISIDNGRITATLKDGVLTVSGTGELPELKQNDDSLFGRDAKSLVVSDGITAIGAKAFEGYPSLEKVVLPSSAETIGQYAFGHCPELKEVTIPEGVKTIGLAAFETCMKLESIRIPASVTSIEAPLFDWCFNLTSLEVDSANTVYDSRNNCNAVMETSTNTLVTGCMGTVIPEDTVVIGSKALAYLKMESVTIPEGVTTIGVSAFDTCSSLKEVYLPKSLKTIESRAFKYCESLKDVYYAGSEGTWENIYIGSNNNELSASAIHYAESGDPEIIETENSISIDNGRITAVIDSNGVMTVSGSGELWPLNRKDGSLFGTEATSLVVTDGITAIGAHSFENYQYLENIEIPASVKSIGRQAFGHCPELKNVTIAEGVESIGCAAFETCQKLESIKIPASVTSIEAPLFDWCYNLTSLEVDKNNTVYDSRNNCNAVMQTNTNTLVTGCAGTVIPADTVIIGEFALAYLNMESVTIPKGVTQIKDNAFDTCRKLTEVHLPAGLVSIGSKAFSECEGLKDVYYAGDETAWSRVQVQKYNEYLTLATMHYNAGSADQHEQVVSYVDRIYTVWLERTPDIDGEADWAEKLQNGSWSGAQVAEFFVFSKESMDNDRSNGEFVDALYKLLMDRDPKYDVEGYAWWVDQMDNGMSKFDVVARFIDSKEYTGICEDYGIVRGDMDMTTINQVQGFVGRFYTLAMERDADQSGVDYWTAGLRRGDFNGASIAANFFFSKEMTDKHISDEKYIELLYQVMMGRPSDDGGKSYWLGNMAGGMTSEQVLSGFITSPEFTGICTDYGIERGSL